jgi:type IV pilus biogenesis protein CpaD/CtpE
MIMSVVLAKRAGAALLAIMGLALSGCAESRLRLSEDYGQAVRQEILAQVADPDAHYKGVPAPGSDGHRVAIATERYNRNAVVQPASTSTSSFSGGGSGASSSPGR